MDIAILGGGIGGLSAAIALKQAGYDASVFERRPAPADIGAGIVCWPNATFILEQLGVLDPVSKLAGLVKSMNRFTEFEEPLGQLDISQLNKIMGYPSYAIVRKDLINILVQRATDLEIPIHFGHDIIDISTEKTKVNLTFSNGHILQPAIAVGADGRMKSIARKYVSGSNSPIYQGFVNWVGVIESAQLSFSATSVSDYWGVGKRFGIVPVSSSKAYWAGGAVSSIQKLRQPSLYKSELNDIFSHWPSIIPKIIQETSVSRINKIYVHDHDPLDCWHKNNLVLLGDAAHSALPTSGQGACQALEDAWHLTQCLKDQPKNLEKAFLLFYSRRKLKTSEIIRQGRHIAASIFNSDADYCEQRNRASQQTDFQEAVQGMAQGWARGLPLSAQD